MSTKGVLPTAVLLGAQDGHWDEKGAFTGCVSCSQLKDMKARYVIVGLAGPTGRILLQDKSKIFMRRVVGLSATVAESAAAKPPADSCNKAGDI